MERLRGHIPRRELGLQLPPERVRELCSNVLELLVALHRTCLVHNDFRLDNVVLDRDEPTRPLGLLDWEMATVGDPLMDLGGALA